MKNRASLTCAECGVIKWIIPSQVGRMRFCSILCRVAFNKRKRVAPVSQMILRELLDYDGDSGLLYWRSTPGYGERLNGCVAGCVDELGYRRVRINGRLYLAHRLIWLFVYGEWPSGTIDHINGCPGDDRIVNLRIATQQQNCFNSATPKNNTSGFKGVSRKRNKWRAYITVDGRQHLLGVFDTAAEAAAARALVADHFHGEFASDGSRPT